MSNFFIVFVVALVSPLFVANVLVRSYEPSHTIQYDLELADDLFQSFLIKHKKVYDDEEYKYRFKIFQENLKRINAFNEEPKAYVLGINSLTDMSPDEFKLMTSCFKRDSLNDVEPLVLPEKVFNIPDELDYRKMGRVTAVKDQGLCGSCYIFGAIGEIEGQYSIKHNLTAFSEQYPLDCSKTFNCDGGDSGDVMKWLANTTGAITLKDYPDHYLKFKCQADPKLALYVPEELQLYKGGVANPKQCETDNKNDTNHAVTLVGYGKEDGEDYWLFKNSWNVYWGEQGYFRLSTKAKCLVGTHVVISEVL